MAVRWPLWNASGGGGGGGGVALVFGPDGPFRAARTYPSPGKARICARASARRRRMGLVRMLERVLRLF